VKEILYSKVRVPCQVHEEDIDVGDIVSVETGGLILCDGIIVTDHGLTCENQEGVKTRTTKKATMELSVELRIGETVLCGLVTMLRLFFRLS
jgi:hypothetical protein